MSPTHRRGAPTGPSTVEMQRHLATALDDEDAELLAGVAQACADQIRALDRLLCTEQDLRSKAERLDYLSSLLFRTNRQRAELAEWGATECAYCGEDVDVPVRVNGRKYHPECSPTTTQQAV